MRQDDKFASHYIRRFRELGFSGTMRRFWIRIKDFIVLWSQSIWWSWRAHRKMSDNAFLAQTIGDWRTVDSLLDHLSNRPASSFLFPHESSSETSQILHRKFPDYTQALFAAADAACRNEVSLLDQIFRYPHGIDWLNDPLTGIRRSQWHINRIRRYLGSPTFSADPILFWELNRHQHLITLGIAYWLTGNDRYVDAFCSQTQGWIKTNPMQHGFNWIYGLEVSIRILAWTAAFQFFRHSSRFKERGGKDFLKSLWQQADYLSNHLQSTWTDVLNNHMMAELVGLVLVATAFPEFRKAKAWREMGLRLLDQQADAQTYSDGVNREQATGYHRFITELLLLIVARSRQGAIPNMVSLENILERMLDYVHYAMTPIGTNPLWGDSDYGRALGLGQNKDFWDFRPLLSAGAVLFERPDWKFAAGRFDEEAFWLLGSSGLNIWEKLDVHPPKDPSRAFPQAGMYIIRDAWTADTDVAFFRCGPFGLGGENHCAHAHCDLLSVILWVSGQQILVDSGTYTYHGPLRDYFRVSTAHNTVMIDGCEQAIPIPHFNWRQIPEANCTNWTGDRVSGELTYPGRVKFMRELSHPQPGLWELVDALKGNDEHLIEWYFHFAPDLEVRLNEKENDRLLAVLKDGIPFLYLYLPREELRYQLRDGWYSYKYGAKHKNRVLVAHWHGEISEKGVPFTWKFQRINKNPLPTGE